MLYYPHYTPSKERLRSILLFSNRVSLIVPEVDQPGVERRHHVAEVMNHDHNLILMNDPSYRYWDWIEKNDVAAIAERLIASLTDLSKDVPEIQSISRDRAGNVHPGQEDKINNLHLKHKWKYVALQKFPQSHEELFFKDGLALKVGVYRNRYTGSIVEHSGVLCHPKLADFVLSRMAREASLVDGTPSITFESFNYKSHLYDGEVVSKVDRFVLLQNTMDLLVPDQIGEFSFQDYLAIHAEYRSIRPKIWDYLSDISLENNLDLQFGDLQTMLDRLSDARQTITEEMLELKKAIGVERFVDNSILTLDFASTVGSAVAGAYFNSPQAASVIAAAGFGFSNALKMMSTLGRKPDGAAKTIAMSKAKFKRKENSTRWDAPSYWRT